MKIITIIFLLIFININNTSADYISDVNKQSYNEYKNNIKNICAPKYQKKKDKLIKKETKYEKAEDVSVKFLHSNNAETVIKATNQIYKNTMNQIYRCAIIDTQIVALKNFNKNVIKKFDKTGDIKKKLEYKLKERITKIQAQKSFNKLDGFEENGDPIYKKVDICTNQKITRTYNKRNVLNNLTYETCKYLYYMDYLDDYYSSLENLGLFPGTEEGDEIAEDIDTLKSKGLNILAPGEIELAVNTKILEARKHAKEVFNMAFLAYTEYENNFPIHLLLQILREDFIVFRQKLHEVLNPINQVTYKIVNCQNL